MAISKSKTEEQENIKMLTILYGAPGMSVSVSEAQLRGIALAANIKCRGVNSEGVYYYPEHVFTLNDFINASPDTILKKCRLARPITLHKILVAIINRGYGYALNEKWKSFIKENKSGYKKALFQLHKQGYKVNDKYIDLKAEETTYSRKSAAKAIEKLLKKAENINQSDEYLYYIDKMVLYGSFINAPEKERVGDVDVAVFLKYKIPNASRGDELQANKERHALIRGNKDNSLNYLAYEYKRHSFGVVEIIEFLKSNSHILSLRPVGAIVTQSIDGEEEHYLKNIVYHHENKVIYERATN
ncbi:MAG: hypothetical protein J5956_11325 [Ruminococcus sp.]|nr:hypothetical protein [Ruminococcus sp.]